jgi:ABC-type phosphate transport system substrate-binding protein
LTVSIEILHPNVVELENVDFYIQLGEPEELPEFTAQLAVEQIVVVLHPGNALELDKAQIADLFSGRVPDWAVLNGEPAAVNLWVGAQSDEGRKAFERILLLSSPIAGWAHLATNPEDLRAAIAADPNAAGILPAAWVNGEVQAVEIGLELPVLALASQEPSGAAREMLVCLQSGRGRSQLGGLYLPLEP